MISLGWMTWANCCQYGARIELAFSAANILLQCLTVSKNEFRRESQVEVWFVYSSEEQEDARNYSHNMQGYFFSLKTRTAHAANVD